MKTPLLLVILLTLGGGTGVSTCYTRRCLAVTLINKELLLQPQTENCTLQIYVPVIEYETLAVDTKNLRLHSRVVAAITWTDPDLAWTTSLYPYDTVVLPVNTIWTPELRVTNGISTQMKHVSPDLVVTSNGTVNHLVEILAEVNCQVNLFNYPFAFDSCPVAIESFSNLGCGTQIKLDKVKSLLGTAGDWKTDGARLDKKAENRNYILVSLRLSSQNPFVTLMLPSILIFVADMVSFALPLGGGERNTFKVTLVLSFVMFLNLLNSELPGDGYCTPMIRIHFCVCLVVLVVSMLVSMLMTRIAQDGKIGFRCWPESNQRTKNDAEKIGEETTDVPKHVEQNISADSQMLGDVVKFLQDLDAKEKKSERLKMLAHKWDMVFFWVYSVSGVAYICVVMAVMLKYKCEVNHFDFWDKK